MAMQILTSLLENLKNKKPAGSPPALGDNAELMTSGLHDKYYYQTNLGQMYFGASATGGIALIVPAITGNHPTLWNPGGSGYNAVITRLQLSYVSGNNAPTSIVWALTCGASQIGTGSPIATFTNVAPISAKIGSGCVSSMKWAPAVNTYTAAPTYLMPTGLSLDTMVAASTNAPFQITVDYPGNMILTPGCALSLCTSAATTTALFQVVLFWYETPI